MKIRGCARAARVVCGGGVVFYRAPTPAPTSPPTPTPTPGPTPAPTSPPTPGPTPKPTPMPTPTPTPAPSRPCKSACYYCESTCWAIGSPTPACKSYCERNLRDVKCVIKEFLQAGVCASGGELAIPVFQHTGGTPTEAGASAGACHTRAYYCFRLCKIMSHARTIAKARCMAHCETSGGFGELQALWEEYGDAGVCPLAA